MSEKKHKFETIYQEPLSKKPIIESAPEEPKKEKLEDKRVHSKSTLFVSTIPFEATAKDLEEFFSEIGPIKSCFVVKNKETGTHNGCGYVQFAIPDDAGRALTELKKKKFQNKRTLKIVWAVRKSVVEERKQAGISLNLEEEEERKAKELERIKNKVKVVPVGPGKVNKTLPKRLENSCTILISDLPEGLTKSVLNKKVRKFGTVGEIIVPSSDNELPERSAKIVYSTPKEAQNAHKHLDQHIYKGVTIKSSIVETVTAASVAKSARLIVRNLAFQCKKEHLLKVFEVFGEITDCQVPHLPDGKARGFGFVQFDKVEDAAKAVEQVNGQKILNRPVAVDWALNKSQYDRLTAAETAAEVEIEVPKEEKEEDEESEQEQESESGDEKEGDSEQMDIESDNEAIIYESDMDSDESDDDSVVVEIDEEVKQKKPYEPDQEGCTLFIRNLSFDTTKEKLKKKFEKFGKLKYALITMDKVTNLSKGNGFVCYESLDDAKACLDAYSTAVATQAQFTGIEQAESKLKKDKNDKRSASVLAPQLPTTFEKDVEKFMIDGRFVNVTEAVSRQIAEKITHSSNMNRRATDKRHLYLMREGVIFPGTPAAALLTPEELEKRVAQFANRKRLLATNPNLFISRTRLSIRGLGPKVVDSQLRSVAKESVKKFWEDVEQGIRKPLEEEVMDEEKLEGFAPPSGKRKAIIKQAKVIKEADRIDPVTKKPKSKGYGFIEFASHADALACLRWLNNNANAFAPKQEKGSKDAPIIKTKAKTPIVEFAVENRLVLKKRSDRNNSSKKKEDQSKKEDKDGRKRKREGDDGKKPKKAKAESKQEKKEAKEDAPAKKKKQFLTFKERRQLRKEKMLSKKTEGTPVAKKSAKVEEKQTALPKVKAKDDKPSKREIKKQKKNSEEENFQSLVSSYKKKFLDTPSSEKSTVKKWYT